MAALVVRLNVAMLSLAAALHAFDVRLFGIRLNSPVQHDSLLHYNMLLTWWRHGDSPRGFTLTPSPYFIDMVVQLPIMLLAPDFERFSYALAFTYAVLIFASLYLVARIVVEAGAALALMVTGLSLVGFYKLAPFNFVVHAFVVNHTSEVFTTLGLLALLHAWFRPGVRSRWYAPYVYACVVAACTASSPFFIATYCIPAAVGAAAILGTEYVTLRRLAWFLGLSGLGALVGLIIIAIVSRYAWPVRGDYYRGWWKSYILFKRTIVAEPGGLRVAWATVIAVIASITLTIVGRRTRRWSVPTTFMLAFFPAAVLACVAIPIKRGAFDGGYAFRYVLLPWLLVVGFYVAIGARVAKTLVAAALRRSPLPALPRRLSWAAGLLGIAGIVIIATFHGSLTMTDPRSRTAPTIQCFRDAEQRFGLRDGLATWSLGRYFNAARHADDWDSPHVVIQLQTNVPPRVDPRDNNLLWFDHRFRAGKGHLNFLVTHAFTDALPLIRERVGAPDHIVTCSVDPLLRADGKDSFELWIWGREDTQRRLTDLVMLGNLRSPFSPVIGATTMMIEPVWGMSADDGRSDLVNGRRIWRRGTHSADGAFLQVNPMWVPSGHYRLDLVFSTTSPAGSMDPVMEVHVDLERVKEGRRFPIAADAHHASIEFEVDNYGGATSGSAIEINLVARAADSIEISGATLTLVEQRGISPFRIFR